MQKKISELFENTGAEAVLLRNSDSCQDKNFFYFSELPLGHYSGAFLLLKQGKKPVLISSSLESKKVPGCRTIVFSSKGQLEKILSRETKGIKKIGLNFEAYPKNAFSRLKKSLPKKFVDVSKAIANARETKTAMEIGCIARAARISEKAIGELPRFFKKGMTEKQVSLKLEERLRENGDNNIAFPTIVALGKNARIPHYITGNAKIKKGLLLVDFGARYKNYCTDLTRMFSVGKASKAHKEAYEKVLEAKKFAQSLCMPDAKCREVFFETNSLLKKSLGFPLAHSLGHGLGIDVHDFPCGFSPKSEDILKEGMVLTLEPAVYTKKFGLRIEDNVLITKKGCRLLSRAPEQITEL